MKVNGYIRLAAAVPEVKLADVKGNVANIKSLADKAIAEGAQVIVFPELSLTGYSCGDLFGQRLLLDQAVGGLLELAEYTSGKDCLMAVGLPMEVGFSRYNCAAFLAEGEVKGIVPKTYLPNYQEFYEKRWFESGEGSCGVWSDRILRSGEVGLTDRGTRSPHMERPHLAVGEVGLTDRGTRSPHMERPHLAVGVVGLTDRGTRSPHMERPHLAVGSCSVPFGTDILVRFGDALIGAEICEDLWVPVPPSCRLACSGANVILNLSATDELIGKHAYLLQLISQQSARCRCAYVYASAGSGESSTDLVYAGNAIIAANGSIAAKSPRFTGGELLTITDIDLERLDHDRMNAGTFSDCALTEADPDIRVIELSIRPKEIDHTDLRAYVDPMPFVPRDKDKLDDHCLEILSIQAAGLAQRLRFTHCKNLAVGISGGLDSTLALLVAVRAFDSLGLDRKGITGITMPGFGTTDRTHSNSWRLMNELGVTALEIPIGKAVNQHFSDIGHDGRTPDVTYENSQARMRTLILMDYANKTGGMVLGTGDLSELALGWCTYNGDHMSMYGVNASVPKTLVRHLVNYVAAETDNPQLREALLDISATPISPELLPSDGENISQKTEDLVGPYELHDFFLYNTLRFGFAPAKVLALALAAFSTTAPTAPSAAHRHMAGLSEANQATRLWGDRVPRSVVGTQRVASDGEAKFYDEKIIKHWLKTFYRRFFNQQFKRSCMPDGPKTGSVCLSPRGDWRMPSDASSSAWLAD